MESALGKAGSVCAIAPVESITANRTIAAPSFIPLPPATLPPVPEPPAGCAANQSLVRMDRTTLAAYEPHRLYRLHRERWLHGRETAECSRQSTRAGPGRCCQG